MLIRWKPFVTKTFIWIFAEILLNSQGLDTLADYSEFVFSQFDCDQNTLVRFI